MDVKKKELHRVAQDHTHCTKVMKRTRFANISKACLATGLTGIFTFAPSGTATVPINPLNDGGLDSLDSTGMSQPPSPVNTPSQPSMRPVPGSPSTIIVKVMSHPRHLHVPYQLSQGLSYTY
jgi:hypothetical protein